MLPDDGSAVDVDDVSRDVDPQHADQVLAEYLQYLASMGAGALVVEDDTAREGDPGLNDAVFWRDECFAGRRCTQMRRN